MDAQGYEFVVKTLQSGPLVGLLGIIVWFCIYRVYPDWQKREDLKSAFEESYKSSWLKTAQMQADRLEALVHEFEDMRHDLNAVLMLLAKDRPELIEFFKARQRRKGVS